MGIPEQDCIRPKYPFEQRHTSHATSTTGQPQEDISIVRYPQNVPCENCNCGQIYVNAGLKYLNTGSYILLDNKRYSLVNNVNTYIKYGDKFIVSCEKIVSDVPIIKNNLNIYLGNNTNITGSINIIVKIRQTQKILGQIIIDSINPDGLIAIDIDSINLANLNLQLEILSICENNNTNCCDQLPTSITLTNKVDLIQCTTTTTRPPFCAQFNLPNSFYVNMIGSGDFIGQTVRAIVTKQGNTWMTSGTFPCGAFFYITMTCDYVNSRFTYDGYIDCCFENTKTIHIPTPYPLLYPEATVSSIVNYTDCACKQCTTTSTTSTTTTDFPTTTTTQPPVPCNKETSITINGYAFYRGKSSSVSIAGVGALNAACYGGHCCDRTNFIPTLTTSAGVITANQISMNNSNGCNDVDQSFSFFIEDTSVLKNGASISLKCASGNCHTGVTWVVLTTTIDGVTSLLFNSCVVPDSLEPLDINCRDCCNWNGETTLQLFGPDCENATHPIKFFKIGNNLWETNVTLECGDTINAVIKCNPEVDFINTGNLTALCKSKWEVVNFNFPCATNPRLTGNLLTLCECNKPPIFEFTADDINGCKCCGFDADFLVLQYLFTNGNDLDTRTSVSASGESGGTVGWCKPSSAYDGSGGRWYEWGGDNTGTGYESVLVYVNNIRTAYPNSNIVGRAAAMWYGSRVSGDVKLNLLAYKGGSMVKTGYTWTNSGGELTASITLDGNVALQSTNCSDEELVSFFTYTTDNILVWDQLP